ncbi:hypothetical protein [Crossiella cryophila]|uniref:Uncharacterized protein n=1 Tax=Crossiella cryophila TaxID=43355 RepID=A0A7W7C6Z7_9PSEU|nr:hypothetical protein [Crossiella cryophila]MBB4675702.1 hypothetical protein [Crossiella cryophila]
MSEAGGLRHLGIGRALGWTWVLMGVAGVLMLIVGTRGQRQISDGWLWLTTGGLVHLVFNAVLPLSVVVYALGMAVLSARQVEPGPNPRLRRWGVLGAVLVLALAGLSSFGEPVVRNGLSAEVRDTVLLLAPAELVVILMVIGIVLLLLCLGGASWLHQQGRARRAVHVQASEYRPYVPH